MRSAYFGYWSAIVAIIRSIQQIGLWPYSIYILGRVLRALRVGDSVHYCIMAVNLPKIAKNAARKDTPALVPLKHGDERLETIDAPADVVVERLDNGAACHALPGKEALKAWIWHQCGCYEEDEVRAQFLLPESAVWDFGAYVVPRYRIGRSFEALWRGFAHMIIDQGQSASISRIATHNTASLNAHSRLPHAVLGYCTFIRVFGLQLCFSSLLPRWHISLNDQDLPVFHLHV